MHINNSTSTSTLSPKSQWRKIVYSIIHSPSLFDAPGTEVCFRRNVPTTMTLLRNAVEHCTQSDRNCITDADVLTWQHRKLTGRCVEFSFKLSFRTYTFESGLHHTGKIASKVSKQWQTIPIVTGPVPE